MTTRDLDRLAKHVKAHRMELYPSRLAAASAVGISKDTWRRVEEGLEVRESTYVKVDKALGWAPGSCLVIADGGEPVLVGQPDAGPAAEATEPPARLSAEALKRAAFEAARAKMPSAPVGEVDAFSDELVEILRRSGNVTDGT